MAKPRLLVTRFAPHASRLAERLNAQGVFALAQPLLAVKKSPEFANAPCLFTKNYDYIIALSRNAVDYTAQALAGRPWPASRYLAVGKGTQRALQQVSAQPVITPVEQFSSEGLLALPCLGQLQGKRVLILRGVGGRELLAETLTARGAVVDYYQPYQRIAVDLCAEVLVKQWQQQGINGAIISSIELLNRLLTIVPESEQGWLKKITLYVPSRRIAEQAALSGCAAVKVLPGMQDQEIIDYFK